MQGNILNIQRYSINDGPGIRTTIFLKGCSLNCGWCHNPEGIATANELQYFEDKCIRCGCCVNVCPTGAKRLNGVDRKKCTACGECIKVCFYGALQIAGWKADSDEIIKTVLKDKNYYENSGGGLTISGGEPLLQDAFTAEVLKKAKAENLHTALDTSGYVEWTAFKNVLCYLDLVLLDIKAMDSAVHRKYTGAGNEVILENAKKLFSMNINTNIRIPVIAGVNNTVSEMEAIVSFISAAKSIGSVKLLPYHDYGIRKAQSIGRPMHLFRQPENLDDLCNVFIKKGFVIEA